MQGTAGIPGIVEAGVQGRVTAKILGHWKDDDQNGKVYLDELLTNLDQGPECVFDITGELVFQLFLFIRPVIGVDVTIPIVPETTLHSFTNKCPPLPPPELAHITDGGEADYNGQLIPAGTLVLNIGPLRPCGKGEPARTATSDCASMSMSLAC